MLLIFSGVFWYSKSREVFRAAKQALKAYFMGTFVSADRTLSSNERSGLRSSLGGSTIKNCSSGVWPKTIFPQKFDWPNVGQWSMQRFSEGNRLAGYGILNFSLWYTKLQLITDQRLPICAQASILHHGAQHLKSRPRILSPAMVCQVVVITTYHSIHNVRFPRSVAHERSYVQVIFSNLGQ
jgi:hypothetical protein